MKHDGWVKSASFSPDGKRVVTASLDKTARIWDADTGKPVGEAMKHDDRVISASFSSDGKRVVTASGVRARVWDADTGKPVGEAMKHDHRVNSASFSPDGKRVVTASGELAGKKGEARVWDADTGKPVGEAMKHDGAVISASFSPDGKRVVTASDDKTARVWNEFWSALSPTEQLMAEVCTRKLFGNVRKITENDVYVAKVLSPEKIGQDVCTGD